MIKQYLILEDVSVVTYFLTSYEKLLWTQKRKMVAYECDYTNLRGLVFRMDVWYGSILLPVLLVCNFEGILVRAPLLKSRMKDDARPVFITLLDLAEDLGDFPAAEALHSGCHWRTVSACTPETFTLFVNKTVPYNSVIRSVVS